MIELTQLIDGIDFGEGPRWRDERLWYSDFFQQSVYTVDLAGQRETVVTIDDRPSGLGWLPDGSLLIVAMRSRRVLRFDGVELSVHADLSDFTASDCNDMVVDSAGNAYVGNFGWDVATEGWGGARPTALALVRPDGSVETAADGLLFPNGAVLTGDGSVLIVGETFAGRYTAFDVASDGTLSGARTWAEVADTSPDGCTLDAGGGIWFADARGSRLLRVIEGGEVTATIETPQPVFACMLGGHEGRTLFALTAAGSDPALAAGSGAGGIWHCEVDLPKAGLP